MKISGFPVTPSGTHQGRVQWPRVPEHRGLTRGPWCQNSSAEPGLYPTLLLGHPCSLQPSPKWVPHADCVVGSGDAAANRGDKALCPSSLHPNWERGTVDTDSTGCVRWWEALREKYQAGKAARLCTARGCSFK